jgi:hypothetical protein
MPPVVAALPSLATIGSTLGSIGSIAGGISAVQGLAGGQKQKSFAEQSPAAPTPEAPFSPKKPEAMARPGELAALGGYDPTQERSALATKGVNVGLGKSEDEYYRNLVSRSLIGNDNKVTGDANSLLPVESQYFSGKGYDTSNVNNLLKAIMGG